MTTTVGKARIEIEVDGSGISKSLEAAMDRALSAVSKSADAAFSKVEKGASSAGDEIGSGIGDGAKAAERALSSIDTDGIDNISKAAANAADAVSKSSADAADSLSDVGAAGAEAGATASGAIASSMADVTSAAATAGARAADSLSGVGGAASEAGATASGAMAGSMADISASAASAFSSVSASAADAAGGVASAAASMSSSMSGAMASIEGAASGAVGGLGGAGGKLGDLARKAGPAAAALAGVAGAGATVKAGFDKLTSIEDTTASLGIILGDLDAATGLMAKLQEDNLTTPYMFDAYAGAGKTLAAFGADLEGIPEQVRALGEAAAASGGGQAVFDSMARASGQAMATGKMSLDTINQLAVGGVQGLQILANHFDVPTAEMQKMISSGMVPAQEAMDILTKGILEGSDGVAGATQAMSGVMLEMSETTSGSMTNLLASFNNLAAAGIEPLKPLIKGIADGLTALNYVVIGIIGGDGLPDWLGRVLKALEPLAWIIGSVTAAFGAMKVGALALAGAKKAVAAATGLLSKALGLLVAHPVIAAIAAITGALVWFFTRTELGGKVWDRLMDGFRAAGEWLVGVFGPIWDGLVEKVTGVIDTVKAAWDELTAAFRGGDDGYGALASLIGEDAAEWAVNTFANVTAAWDELKAAFTGGDDGYGALSAILGEGTAETVVNAIASIGEGLRTAWELAQEFGRTVVDAITPLLPVFLDLAKSIGGALFSNLKTIVGAVMSVAESVWGLIQAVAPVLLPILKVVAGVLGGALFVAFKVIVGAVKLLAGVIKVAAEVFTWLVDNVLTPLVTFLIDVVAGAFSLLVDVVTGAVEGVQAAWEGLWGFLQTAWENVGRPVIDFIVAAFQFWWDGVSLIFRLLGAAWEVLWTGLGMAWEAFGQPVVDLVVAGFQFLWSGVEVIFGWLKSGWDLLWAGVRAVYDAVIAPVVQWVQDRFNDLRSGVSTALGYVKDAIQGAADRVAEFYNTYVRPMVDSVINGFNRVVDTVTGWKDTIIGALSSAGTWLVDTGKNIVQGLIDGITSLAGKIGEAFLNQIPDWIKEPFKVALGIESPSKVFAEYGQNIGEGLIEGIGGMEGQVGAAVEGITEAATPAAVAMPASAGYGPLAAPVAAPAAVPDSMPMSAPIVPEISTTASVDLDAAGLAGAMGEAGESVVAVRETMIDPALTGMAENLTGLAATAGLEGQNLTNAMNLAGAGVLGVKDTLVDPALRGMQANLQQTALTTQQQMVGKALPAMQQTGAGIMSVQTGTVNPALTAMQGAVHNTAAAFGTGTNAINTEFNKVREGVAAPTRFAIGPVFNDGLVGMWNSVSEMVGLEKMNPYPIRFASGGIMPGYTPGRDPFQFIDPVAGISLGLSGGEAIMRPEWTRALGAQTIHAMNRVAAQEGVSGVRRMWEHSGLTAAYASGGIFGVPHLGNFSQGAIIDSMTSFVNRFFPQLSLTSGWRFTDNGYHSKGMAGDFSNQVWGGPPTPASIGLANAIYKNFAAQTLELIHWPLSGWQNLWHGRPHMYNAATNAQHTDHVHWALPAPLQAAGTDLDLSSAGPAVVVDPRQIIESIMGDSVEETKKKAHGFTGMGGRADKIPGAFYDTMIDPIMDTLEEAFLTFGGDPGGADVERWRPLAMQALARHGYDASQYIDAMMQQIMIESGGNPQAINLWDSNAMAGIPSGGLLQVIEPTYRRVRAAYPEAFAGLPDDRWHPLTNLTAGVGAVRMDWGGPGGRWPTRDGYDLGGLASGIGLMPKHILDPERVLSPRQTEAFEAWMNAGARVEDINKLIEAVTWREDPANLPVVQPEKVLTADQEAVFDEWRGQGAQIDSIHELVDSMHGLQLDHPEIMGREINRRFRAWLGEAPEDNTGDVRHLVAALEAGVEWERVVHGMQRSAEAWANGQWVQVGKDTRLATPAEMGQQISENFLEELADELGGYVGLRGLYKGRDIVGESGLVKLELPDEVKDAEIVPSTEGAPVVATATPTATGKTTAGEAQNVEVTVNIDVSGVNDPMAVSDLVLAKVGKGVEEAIGTARSQ